MKKSEIIKQFKSVPLKSKQAPILSGVAWVAVGAATAALATFAAFKIFKPKPLALSEPETLEKTELHYPQGASESVTSEEPVQDEASNKPPMDLNAKIEDDLKALAAFADWAGQALAQIDDRLWYVALGEGKWSLHEVLAHLYYWDKYTLEEMLPQMAQDAKLQFIEIQKLNDQAWTFGKTFERELLLELFVSTRKRMIQCFEEMPDKTFTYTLGGGEATLHSYLKIFVHHDTEHKPQFEKALTAVED